MAQLRLDLPCEVWRALRRLARQAQIREAEYARELLVRAVERAERERFFEEMERNMTPAARKRLLAIASAIEEVRSPATRRLHHHDEPNRRRRAAHPRARRRLSDS
jgi:hypothetical protein